MKGDPAVIKLLNAQLTNELTAINQYFLHARIVQQELAVIILTFVVR